MNDTPKLAGLTPQPAPQVVQQNNVALNEVQQRKPPPELPDVRRNGLEALHPQFQKKGPQFKATVFKRSDLAQAKASLAEMRKFVEARYSQKTAQLNSLSQKSWILRTKLFGNLTLGDARDEVDSLSILKAAVAKAETAAQDFDLKYKNFHGLRAQNIPVDANERAALFERIRNAGNELKAAYDRLEETADDLDDKLMLRRDHLKATRTVFRRVGGNASAYRSFDAQLAARHAFRRSLPQTFADGTMTRRVSEELGRVDQLEKQLDEVAKGPNGQQDLKLILGDPDKRGPHLQAGIALRALAVGEPLSPHLKNTWPKGLIRGELKEIGHGSFNTVYRAKFPAVDKDGNEVLLDYAVKPLDATIHGSPQFGLEKYQSRVFARQLAAHEISQAMGLDLVGKPNFIDVDGTLCMATPLVRGVSPDDLSKTLSKEYGRETLRNVMSGLHNNPKLQNAIKDVQLFYAVTGNPDGHKGNMKIRFLDGNGKSVSVDKLAKMSKDEISQLDVKVGLFDLDMAFMPIHDPNPVFQKNVYPLRGQVTHDFFPMRSHYLGPPPFHTEDDYRRIEQLEQNLENGALGQSLNWSLTHDEQGHDELGAMKSRVAGIKAAMDEQYQAGRRLDGATGQTIDPNDGEPKGQPSQQKDISDTAPKTRSYVNSLIGFVDMRQSLIHKLFPRR